MLLQGVADLLIAQVERLICETAARDGQASVLCKSWAAWPYIINHFHHEEALHPFISWWFTFSLSLLMPPLIP